MHIWKVTQGGLQVLASSLRPNIFEAHVYLITAARSREVPGVKQANGTFRFELTASHVEELLSPEAVIFASTRHALSLASPDPRWGWRYKLMQGMAPLQASDAAGHPLALDAEGFFRSPLGIFGDPVEWGPQKIDLRS